jgi:hypothetical protein
VSAGIFLGVIHIVFLLTAKVSGEEALQGCLNGAVPIVADSGLPRTW